MAPHCAGHASPMAPLDVGLDLVVRAAKAPGRRKTPACPCLADGVRHSNGLVRTAGDPLYQCYALKLLVFFERERRAL